MAEWLNKSVQFDRYDKSFSYFLKAMNRCETCNEFGHIGSKCYKVLKKCIYCTSDHSFLKCPENLCHLCKNPFHTMKSCTSTTRCILCNISGHSESSCLSKQTPLPLPSLPSSTCLTCRKPGHLNCSPISPDSTLYSRTCSSCGLTGHPFSECPKKCKISKAQLFKVHVKEAMKDLPEFDRKLNCKERKYWEKVRNKAFKKTVKLNKLRKKKKKLGKNSK